MTYSVEIYDPVPEGGVTISNQGSVDCAQLAPILTDDPATSAVGDPTSIGAGEPVVKCLLPIAVEFIR